MTSSPAAATSDNAMEILTFTLGNEEYGIDILKVQEIRGYETTTHIANAPPFIKGVINLRGTIVPIVDLRIRFNVGEATYDEFTVVIILNVGNRVVGMVVDGVSDVLALAEDNIKPPPQLSSTINIAFIRGLGTLEKRMIILIDIEGLMASADMALIDTVN
ncbi:MAG TPA: chemotaxis protein CheW [Permianibacter sp.]|nr:chemotaxis protein CheW [Permianibacter sp.]